MPDVKTNATLPKGETNGLADIASALIREPKKLRAVIGIIDARRETTDFDEGEPKITVRFRRVEVLLEDDLGAAEKLIRRALEARSGQATLPLELEDEISAAFAGLDPAKLKAEEDADAATDEERPTRRRPGRPKGSRNKPKKPDPEPPAADDGEPPGDMPADPFEDGYPEPHGDDGEPDDGEPPAF